MSAEQGLLLPFDFQTYWLHASGEGGGADFDLKMERDAHRLPLLRGKHVAGLLRLALERAAAWGWFADAAGPDDLDIPDLLMGGRSDGRPGCLDVRSAVIRQPLAGILRSDQAMTEACFQRLATTAIEPLHGVAREKHLRTIEAALPLPLQARVRVAPADRLAWCGLDAGAIGQVDRAAAEWRKWVRLAWPAVDEAGAKRTRGFGRLRPADCVDESLS